MKYVFIVRMISMLLDYGNGNRQWQHDNCWVNDNDNGNDNVNDNNNINERNNNGNRNDNANSNNNNDNDNHNCNDNINGHEGVREEAERTKIEIGGEAAELDSSSGVVQSVRADGVRPGADRTTR